MKYSLRSLMIVVIIAPPLLAWGVCIVHRHVAANRSRESQVRWLTSASNSNAAHWRPSP